MFKFTIRHRYCGMTTTITGVSLYDAFAKSGKDYYIWNIIDIERID